jgi:hypothetical protein
MKKLQEICLYDFVKMKMAIEFKRWPIIISLLFDSWINQLIFFCYGTKTLQIINQFK